jgi:hypothetical protein
MRLHGLNSFKSCSTLKVGEDSYESFRLETLEEPV